MSKSLRIGKSNSAIRGHVNLQCLRSQTGGQLRRVSLVDGLPEYSNFILISNLISSLLRDGFNFS